MARALRASRHEDRATSRRAVLVVVSVVLAAAAFAPPAGAAKPVFAAQPIGAGAKEYFVLRARPGRTLSGKLRITNLGHAAGTASLFAVDATTGQTTGAVYQGEQVARHDVGAWTHVGRRTLRLAPGQGVVVPFTVHVPRGAQPGTHLGGLVARNDKVNAGGPARRGKGTFRVRIQNLNITALQIEIPGPRTSRMALTGVVRAGGASGGHQAVLVGLRNTGNTLVKPRLRVVLHTRSGAVLQRAQLQLDTFVPRTEVLYPVQVRGRALAQGDYTADVAVSDARGHVQQQATTKFSVSQKDEKQVFGSSSPLAQETGGSSLGSYLPWILVALLGAAAFVMFRRQRKLSA